MKRLLLFLLTLTPTLLCAQETDVALQDILIPTENSPGLKAVRGRITNNGPNVLDGLHVNYRVNGQGEVFTHVISDLGLEVGESFDFSHDELWDATELGDHSVEVWLLGPNGGLDLNNDNNLQSKTVSVAEDTPIKYILMEEFAAIWCGWCPEGDLVIDSLEAEIPNLIINKLHSDDHLSSQVTDSLAAVMGNGLPCAMLNRTKFEDQYNVAVTYGHWRSKLLEVLNEPAQAIVHSENSYDPVTGRLSVSVSAEFLETMQGDFRFNCHLVQKENVSDMGQANFYDVLEGHPLFEQGNPIANYPHKNVVLEVLGGPWGQEGLIDDIVAYGQHYETVFETSLPEGSSPSDFYLVSYVQKFDEEKFGRTIINAFPQEIQLSTATSIDQIQTPHLDVAVHPNPISRRGWIKVRIPEHSKVNLRLYDAVGKEVMIIVDEELTAGEHNIAIELAEELQSGMYLIRGNSGDIDISSRLVVYK